MKARFLRLVDLQRLRVGKREPILMVRPVRGESAPERSLAVWMTESASPSLIQPMSYSKWLKSLLTECVQSSLRDMSVEV